MNRITIGGSILSLLSFLALGLVWTGLLKIPYIEKDTAEAIAFLLSGIFALVAFVYHLYEKANRKSSSPQYLAPPPANLLPGIIPRTDELRKLRRELLQSQRPVVICGVGGLGKTTFAQQFCQQYGRKFDHVIWLYSNAVFSNALTRETENEDYFFRAFTENRALLTNLKVVFEDREEQMERFQKVITQLCNLEGRLLLVIDNAPELAARWVDDLSRMYNTRILLTSRDAIHNMDVFRLDTLSPNKAAQVFFNIYGQRTMDPALDELLQTYGYHTLTIELLAAYAREKNLGPGELLAELQQKSLLDLDPYDLSLPNAPKRQSLRERLLQTFLLELEEKEQEIMRYMCILPTDGAPIEPELMSEGMLARLFSKTEAKTELHNILQGLVRLHWLVEKNGCYRCHPVIAETAKAQLLPDSVNCGVLIENVAELLKPNEETNEPQIKRAPFGPLAEAVFKGVWKEQGDFVEGDGKVSSLALWLGNLLSSSGEIFKCLEYTQKAVSIREKVLPPEHPDLATPYNNLGGAYRELGEYNKCLELLQKALSIREKVLNLEHPDLAESYNNLAVIYGALGDDHKRLEYNEKSLSIREKILPPEHPDLAISYNNLAATYRNRGEHQKCLEFLQKAMSIQDKILPLEHPALATLYNNLAVSYGALGKHQQDLEYSLKALSIQEKVLPSEHPDLALSYNNLAWTYYNLGDLSQAVDFMHRALAIWAKSLPTAHPDVVMAKESLAYLEKELGADRAPGRS